MNLTDNPILKTDSYKLTHFTMLQPNAEGFYSYTEARLGAEHDFTLAFGFQAIVKKLVGSIITTEAINQAEAIAIAHMGSAKHFNRAGWEYIRDFHGGKLPLVIKAVPEGLCIPVGNVLMTIETTDKNCIWLTNYVESLLMHVWYPITVATLSKSVKNFLVAALERSGTPEGVDFMLHDFGYRGASTDEAAGIGGAAHLVNFKGTDTLLALAVAIEQYMADPATLAFSIPATEHGVMTALGNEGEFTVAKQVLAAHPDGLLAEVADSYDYYAFVRFVCSIQNEIKARDGKFIVRPDSCTPDHPTPESLVLWTADTLYETYGAGVNAKGYKVLDPHIGMIWGDGIDPKGIEKIVNALMDAGYSADIIAFGMGGGLLQKVNRDTERFATKCSAQKVNGTWVDVQKNPLDKSKKSKAGRLKLIFEDGVYRTVRESDPGKDVLRVIYANGHMVVEDTFDEIRERSNK